MSINLAQTKKPRRFFNVGLRYDCFTVEIEINIKFSKEQKMLCNKPFFNFSQRVQRPTFQSK